MRDRLIELLKQAEKQQSLNVVCGDIDSLIDSPKGAEFIADYLLANGVVVPPCKVGDVVYTYSAKRIKEWKITFVGKNSRNEYKFIAVVGKCEDLLTFWNYEIGKTVFLTEEEAERALKGGVQ